MDMSELALLGSLPWGRRSRLLTGDVLTPRSSSVESSPSAAQSPWPVASAERAACAGDVADVETHLSTNEAEPIVQVVIREARDPDLSSPAGEAERPLTRPSEGDMRSYEASGSSHGPEGRIAGPSASVEGQTSAVVGAVRAADASCPSHGRDGRLLPQALSGSEPRREARSAVSGTVSDTPSTAVATKGKAGGAEREEGLVEDMEEDQAVARRQPFTQFSDLPNEVTLQILTYLDLDDLLSTSRVCTHLRSLCRAPYLHRLRLRHARAVLLPLLNSPARPSLADLIARSIFLTRTTVLSRQLGRSLTSIRLSHLLSVRPSPETLVARCVLPPECVPPRPSHRRASRILSPRMSRSSSPRSSLPVASSSSAAGGGAANGQATTCDCCGRAASRSRSPPIFSSLAASRSYNHIPHHHHHRHQHQHHQHHQHHHHHHHRSHTPSCTYKVAPALVAPRRAIERERVKDGLRRWVGSVWRREVLSREEHVRRWEERVGVGRVWRLRRFWERVGRGEEEDQRESADYLPALSSSSTAIRL